MNWIEREKENLKFEEEEKIRNLNRIRELKQIIFEEWKNFKTVMQKDISEINSNSEIQAKMHGAIDFFEEGIYCYRLQKQTFPAIYMEILLNDFDIEIVKRIVSVVDPKKFGQSGGETREEVFREKLRLISDENKSLFFKIKPNRPAHFLIYLNTY